MVIYLNIQTNISSSVLQSHPHLRIQGFPPMKNTSHWVSDKHTTHTTQRLPTYYSDYIHLEFSVNPFRFSCFGKNMSWLLWFFVASDCGPKECESTQFYL